jgi:hypothetical protein
LDFTELEVYEELETFGLMFQLGDMGTFIIPIDLSDGYFENTWRDLSRLNSTRYSEEIYLVNYLIDANQQLYVDNLSSANAEKWGAENSEELFYSTVEDPALFSEMTKDLLSEYRKYTH